MDKNPPKNESLEETFIRRALQDFRPMIEGMDAQLGPAYNVMPYSPEQQVLIATDTNYTDPVQRRDKIIELLQSGMSAAEVTVEIYPKLMPMIKLAGPDIRDQISYAKKLRKLIDERRPYVDPEQEDEASITPGFRPTYEPTKIEPFEMGSDMPSASSSEPTSPTGGMTFDPSQGQM